MHRKLIGLEWVLIFMVGWMGVGFSGLPDWAKTGKSKQYPSSRYLIGVGEAAERAQAEDLARAEIAKIFEARVQSETQDLMTSLKTYQKSQETITSEEQFKGLTKVSTASTQKGVEIVEVTVEKKKVYALAVLDRVKMMQQLTDQIAELDVKISHDIQFSASSEDKLEKIRHLKRALMAMLERRAINAQFVIVNSAGQGIDPSHDFTKVTQELETLLSQNVKLKVKFGGADATSIETAVIGELNQLGFRVSQSDEPADFTVDVNVTVEPYDHPNKDWKWAKFTAQLKLVHVPSNAVLMAEPISGVRPNLTAESARAKALKEAQSEIVKIISMKLRDFLFKP